MFTTQHVEEGMDLHKTKFLKENLRIAAAGKNNKEQLYFLELLNKINACGLAATCFRISQPNIK